MDLSALTELFGQLAGFFGGFKDVFSGLGAIFENGAALSSGSEGAEAGA
ncbi:PorACj family cell wall channel-forming small protein [Corynebacterium nuruki]